MKQVYSLCLLVFFCIQCISAQMLDATISVDAGSHLVITINSDAAFEFNQTVSGVPSLVIKNVYAVDPQALTTSINGGSGISFTGSNGNSGTANQMGPFGIDYGIYSMQDDEITFTDPGPAFNSGDVITIQAGTIISTASFTSLPTINPGPYTAFIASDDYFSIAASQVMLPVELTNFSGHEADDKVYLNWETASEMDNKEFQIEHARDGKNWEKIGFLNGVGTSEIFNEYEFLHNKPSTGKNYYRLKQLDFDGQFEYSKVICVNFKEAHDGIGRFYPNPSTSGLINLDYLSKSDDPIVVTVFDMTGKLIVSQMHQVLKGDNNLIFDFSDLNRGIYIIEFGDESNPTHQKIIIE